MTEADATSPDVMAAPLASRLGALPHGDGDGNGNGNGNGYGNGYGY
jgi:hypothetical protein